jgi:hypothetical protein
LKEWCDMQAKKNPLYVVTNNGQDVETADSLIDLVIKKFGLEPVIEMLQSLLSMLSDQVGNYGFFLFLQQLIDGIVAFFRSIYEKVAVLTGK